MKLSDFFHSVPSVRTEENGEGTAVRENQNTAKINRQIRALIPGQTLQGEVVSKNGRELQIKLTEDMTLWARLEREMTIDIGKVLTFEVRNNGKNLTLSPLFANTASDGTVCKALEMASLPVNASSVEMVQSMMEQGMSIDKNSIGAVYREVTAHMDAAVRDIVQLHRLGMEAAPENIQQLHNYNALEHQLTGAMNRIMEELFLQFETLLSSKNPEAAYALLEKCNRIFPEYPEGEVAVPDGEEPLSDGEEPLSDRGEPLPDRGEMLPNREAPLPNREDPLPIMEKTAPAVPESIPFTEEKESAAVKTVPIRSGVAEILPESGTATEMTDVIRKRIKENWLLPPEKFAEKENVEKLYRRMGKQLGELQKALSEMPETAQSGVMKSVVNMQSNLDFMNQLNQAFTYVQLPLLLEKREGHGDLYVYTNKKNLAQEEGAVSAFLHLDMEYLGAVDVYVAMQNQKVNTKFYLKDDETIDFIQKNIHILNERLAKRGYSMNCEMLVKESQTKAKSVMECLTEQEKGAMVLSQYAFDVRA